MQWQEEFVGVDVTSLEKASSYFGGYHPIKFALMLLFLGAAAWLFVFGKIGNPKNLQVTWTQVSAVTGQIDQSLYGISQYLLLAQWFDESLFKASQDGSRLKQHALWLGRTDPLLQDANRITIAAHCQNPDVLAEVLVIRRVRDFIKIENLGLADGLPRDRQPLPTVSVNLESVKKGETIDLLLALVARNEASFELIRHRPQPPTELLDYKIGIP